MAAPDDAVNVRRRGGRIDIERLKARILRNVEIDPVTGCWNWKRRCNNQGYGEMSIRIPGYDYPRKFLVHRVAYECWKGRIKRGLIVGHTECDNPPCCCPDHTKPQTQSQNLKECAEKGRHRKKVFKVDQDLFRPLLEPHLLPAGEVPYECVAETASA